MIAFIKKYKLVTVSIFLGIVFFIVAILSFDFDEVVANFEKMSASKFLLYFLAANITFTIGVWRWSVILKSYSIKVNFAKLYLWRLAGWAGNYITPSAYIGGEPIRAMFISKEYGVKFKLALANVVSDSFLNIFTEILLTSLAAFFAILHFNKFLRFEESFIVAIVLIVATMYFLYWRISRGKYLFYPLLKFLKVDKWKPKIFKEIFEFEELFIDFFNNKKVALKKGLALSGLLYLATLFEFWILAYFLGVNLSLWHIILFKVFMVLGYIIPIPAGLGTAEITLAKFFELFGYSPSIGVASNLLIRLKDSLMAVFGFLVLSSYGIGFLKPTFRIFKRFFHGGLGKIIEPLNNINHIDYNNKKE